MLGQGDWADAVSFSLTCVCVARVRVYVFSGLRMAEFSHGEEDQQKLGFPVSGTDGVSHLLLACAAFKGGGRLRL